MTTIIGGASQNAGHEYTAETKNVSSASAKATGGRVVKLTSTGEFVTKITSLADIPYGICVGEIGKTNVNTYSLSECICIRGRNVYAELDSTITTLTAGADAHITADGTITSDPAGSYIGVFTSSQIIDYNGKKACLVRVG
jgi:hypothetical protein